MFLPIIVEIQIRADGFHTSSIIASGLEGDAKSGARGAVRFSRVVPALLISTNNFGVEET
jgi:hypothetical protein